MCPDEEYANIHPYYDVYVSESDMSFWKVVMEGGIDPSNIQADVSLLKVPTPAEFS